MIRAQKGEIDNYRCNKIFPTFRCLAWISDPGFIDFLPSFLSLVLQMTYCLVEVILQSVDVTYFIFIYLRVRRSAQDVEVGLFK